MAAYTTIDDPEAYFQVLTYTGNGSSQSMTLDGDTDMQPDFVWIKNRQDAENHNLTDSVRGEEKVIFSNANNSEATETNGMSSFDSDGFGVSVTNGALNASGEPFVAWCWKESATAGFDMVGYTGNDTARTIAHSLSAVPHMMIIKNTGAPGNDLQDWRVYHHKNTSAPETDYLILNTNAATADNPQFNDTAPTSSVFSVGTATSVNGGGGGGHSMIAYLFSGKQGYSKFGSYTGNGNADGPFIYTGFRPAYFLVKESSDSGGFWGIYDNKRVGYNGGVGNEHLKADENGTGGSTDHFSLLSNGLKCHTSSGYLNEDGETYIYAAFAEQPFVNSEGVPATAR